MTSSLQDNYVDLESNIVAQCDAIIASTLRQKDLLLAKMKEDMEHKQTSVKQQMSHCAAQLQKTTGLLQFSIEVFKATDPLAFLQVYFRLLTS